MTRKRPRRYTDKERADCVATLIGCGYPDAAGALEHVHKLTGVPRATLHGWYHAVNNPPPDDVLAESVKTLSELLETEIRLNFYVMQDKRAEATYRELALANAVFVDKLQLLSGQPTENVKQAITFERTGITTLPEHLASSTVDSATGEEAV